MVAGVIAGNSYLLLFADAYKIDDLSSEYLL